MSATVQIGGKTYHGRSIRITGGTVIVDGVVQDGDKLTGVVEVKVQGDLESLDCDAAITVNGTIKGNVHAAGSISAGDIGGSVNAGGSISCGNVRGSVNAGGSINRR